MKINIPSHLTDAQLVAKVTSLARCEREATAHLIAHLVEFDARRLHLGAGFSSLFSYCCEVLGLSEHESYNRIEAARTARQFPVILDMLVEGCLNLTTVRLLAPHLTTANHRELLAAASRKSKREVEELLAGYFPRPDVPSSVRKVAIAREAPPAAPVMPVTGLAAEAPPTAACLSAPASPPPPTRRPLVGPLAPDRYEIRFTASAKTYEKLRLAQDLLRHAVPTGDLAEIFDRALTALLEDVARKKFAATDRPRASRGTAPGSRDTSAKVRRSVWLRDSGRCAFIGKDGRRCNARAFLEFHHVVPYGVGGEPTVENIELRCRAHNGYEADLFYGSCRPGGREGVVRESSAPYGPLAEHSTRSGTSSAAAVSTPGHPGVRAGAHRANAGG